MQSYCAIKTLGKVIVDLGPDRYLSYISRTHLATSLTDSSRHGELSVDAPRTPVQNRTA